MTKTKKKQEKKGKTLMDRWLVQGKTKRSVSTTKKTPKYPLNTTFVKKVVNDDKHERGTLTGYNASKDTYQITFQNNEVSCWTLSQVDWGINLDKILGKLIAKPFFLNPSAKSPTVFTGKVVNADKESMDEVMYKVLYEDGDTEEYTRKELQEWIDLYEKEEKKKETKKRKQNSENTVTKQKKRKEPKEESDKENKTQAETTGRQSRRCSQVNYGEEELMDTDEDEFEEETQKRNRRRLSKKSKTIDSDEESEFEAATIQSDEDDELSDGNLVGEDKSKEVAPKPKRTKKPKQAAKSTKAEEDIVDMENADGKLSKSQMDLQKRLKNGRASYKPNNNPQKLPLEPYVDPVGVDPTQGIVEGIISTQVSKLGKLLTSALADDKSLLKFPLRLQTACSGTDAPSIALGLVQESLSKLTDSRSFEYSHEMSCEIEPFKQAYIGRNFPGVPLFPDITKLTASPEVVDVYGRPQTIPDGNLFVAGTSCKDFSMLKTRDRLDIEDKGTSGETFLAAVEFLEIKQPPVAIFENVDGAPWDKMQEYIKGRLDLKHRNDTKAIKDAKKKGDADNELKFSVNEVGRYVAEEIPRQVGIRAGSVIQGYVKAGHDANDVTPLSSKDNSKKGKFITLGQLAKQHKIDLNKDVLVMEKKARYCTRLVKLDTKNYGLPQTRNRKYLFIWRSDDPNDDLGDYFAEIVKHLETPLLYSMDAFLLPPTHDRIRCFREALRSGPGLMVARERSKELDFWDWELSQVKDLPLHLVFRELNGIEEKSRYLTGWDTRGRKLVAPGLWTELVDMWNHRRCDMIDCFGAAAIRDAISRDPLHHSFTWDISQNVTRAPFRSATVGVSGCVTPGGELVLPHKGRTAMGYEKLLLQGIPFSRLLLGPESEVQLSDLAGNAMSVPVVCATMLAAICAPQLRREREKGKACSLSTFALHQKYDGANGAVLAERGDLYNVERDTTSSLEATLAEIANDLASDAFFSSVLCFCESSGRTTYNPIILECQGCGMFVCHDCSGRIRTSTHDLKEMKIIGSRPDPHIFERKLRCAVPSMLQLGEGWEDKIDEAEGLEAYSFQLQQVDRNKGHWCLTYGAWEDHGSARQVAEIRIVIGRIGTLDRELGVAAYIRCFAPAIRHEDPFRGPLSDSARLMIKVATTSTQQWEVREKGASTCSIKLVGSDPGPSQRVQVGLNKTAYNSLKGHKPMKSFIPKIKSRNNLIAYHDKWETWPTTIVISGDVRVDGTYLRMKCEQTIVHSALWRRDSTPPLYIYFRPDVIRSGLDKAVISSTPSYRDHNMEICELEDWIPENSLTEETYATKAKFISWKFIPSSFKIEIPTPKMIIKNHEPESFHRNISISDSCSSYTLCEMHGLSPGIIKSLLQYTGDGSTTDDVAEIDLFGRSGTANSKRLSILAAPSLLKCAAEGKLPLELSKWYEFPSSDFGLCEVNIPPRPMEKWRKLDGTSRKVNVERYYDATESKEYYQKLLKRPTAFQINVEKSSGKLVVQMKPAVAAHRAAAFLVRRRENADANNTLHVDYCLSELSSMGEPDTKEFHVPNSDPYKETPVDGLELPLYPRQAKALTRMLAIENGDVHFSEEERSEHVLPGVGWCLIARAAKKSPLRGGVLGDAIGSGKTVVTIALILAGVAKARANCNVEKRRSGATLIVVPPGLVKQWDDERKKFTKNKLQCITIDCTSTLKRYSVKDICNADILIVPADLLEERQKKAGRPYTEHLAKKAGADPIPPAPTGYSQREAPTIEGTWVRNMASGPEIYVGNKGNQRTRDEQAYYGHCYSEAIKRLRGQTFRSSEKGVPLEYFTWERIVIDECHETLVTGKQQETDAADFKAPARRGAREFLGVAQTDAASRPLVATAGVWGLTGTPLLETEARVTELANLMGGTYLTGAAHHWRKEERESGRDLFLNQQEGTRSREYRCAIQESCHLYVKEACQRNRGAKLQVKLTKDELHVNMSAVEGDAFLKVVGTCKLQGFSNSPDQLGEKASNALSITASSKARHTALLKKINSIQEDECDTKIIVFANTVYGGYSEARTALQSSGKRFCHISDENTVHEQNETISWFRHVDATEEDRARPRILLLSYEQAAGHNLQEACHHVILYEPMYSGTDAVADASVEEQAIGRVMRQGQKYDVTVTRIVVQGPKGERCLDNWIVERNLDEEVLRAATSNFD